MEKAANDIGLKNSLRFERKFVYQNITLEDLLKTEVLVNPYGFKEIFHRRTVNNIYFDDFNMSFYRQNVAGDANREKYRLRWYGDTFINIKNPTFEIKKKFGEVGDKYSFKLPETEFSLLSANAQSIKDRLEDKLTALDNIVLATKLKSVEPTLFNSYERRYFLSCCENFRITLDYNQCFFNPNIDNLQASRVCIDDIVLELKYATPYDTESRNISQYLSARLSKNSKYVTGVDTMST